MVPNMEEITEALNQDLEESHKKALEEEKDEDMLDEDMDDDHNFIADSMSGFCLKK